MRGPGRLPSGRPTEDADGGSHEQGNLRARLQAAFPERSLFKAHEREEGRDRGQWRRKVPQSVLQSSGLTRNARPGVISARSAPVTEILLGLSQSNVPGALIPRLVAIPSRSPGATTLWRIAHRSALEGTSARGGLGLLERRLYLALKFTKGLRK
jgi:hypothetical protein